ncbi:sensor histidine kinase [Sphingomonas ginkgonis]|uniref:histidine kinase n=1 Tax=Sphingomonas ginkgonis TaxID=2315330 RepID=A0A3R9YLY4_9SPHN|nr:ATP-binding protein [Sphingomonas ginkgonis]RST30722.1 sensor histidine kinase [Sphingomonas ginkgonis]
MAAFTLLVFALQLLAVGGLFFFVERSSLAAQQQDERSDTAELRDALLDNYRAGGRAALVDAIDVRLGEIRTEAEVILLEGKNGEELAGNLSDWPASIPFNAAWREIELYRKNSQAPAAVGLIATSLPDGSSLLTGHVIEGSRATRTAYREALLDALLISVPLALLIAGIAELFISRRLAKVARTVRGVRDGDLSERVAAGRSGDAFERLGSEVNAMLDQIEDLIRELRNLTDGLAHDLRSPLTRLKLKIDQGFAVAQTERGRTVLQSIAQEADVLLAMLSTTLEISRAEAGIGRQQLAKVNLSELLADLCELYEPVAEERGFELTTTIPPAVRLLVQRDQVARAVANLLDNATLYASGGSQIGVELVRRSGGADIIVSDNGPGIPEQRHAEALKRFGRLDPSRHLPGSGLGLTLADAVARFHDGHLLLQDGGPGLRVVIQLRTEGTAGD